MNIGAVIIRYKWSIQGYLCKRCISRTFWKYTPVTLLIGWVSISSLLIAPGIALVNLVHYLGSMFMPAPPPDARRPELTPEASARLIPFVSEIEMLLQKGHHPQIIAQEVASRANVDQGDLSKIERGLANPTFATLSAVALAVDYEIDVKPRRR